MGELEKIADARVHASGQEIVRRLRTDIEALHRRYAATRGLGGGTIVESQTLCAIGLQEQGKASTEQFEWVIKESLLASQPLVDLLVSRARDHLDPVFEESQNLLKLTTDRVRHPQLLARSIAELTVVRDKVWTDSALAIQAAAAQTKRRAIRNGFNASIGWVSKLFGGSRGS
ncbi:MAG: hypothetical protein NTV11_04465 [Rhodocyclales bacterium]|nr:hypothetical protein [Rhodocyclales bacterium]